MLLIAAFGMKIALPPMHFWMPLSYTVTPVPAAAVLSGAAVKAGIIGLIRFLPFDMALPGWGELLTIIAKLNRIIRLWIAACLMLLVILLLLVLTMAAGD